LTNADAGLVMVHLQASGVLEPAVGAEIKSLAGKIAGLKEVEVRVTPLSLI
jgi:hypothetical protein